MGVLQKGHVFIRMFVCVFLAILLGTLAMIFVYALPVEPMYRNVQTSMMTIDRERPVETMNYLWISWSGDTGFVHTSLNSWSDHIMLMQAIYPASDSPVQDAMLNRRWLFAKADVTTTDTLLRNLQDEGGQQEMEYRQLRSMDGTVDSQGNSMIYPRYWHGYLTFLKPLLLVTNITGIRILNCYLQFALMALSIVLFYKKLGALYTASFVLVLLSLSPVSLYMVFQIDAVVYIMLLSVIVILWKNGWLWKERLYLYFFLLIGIATAFFDFLTFPLVGLGIPWLVYFLLNREHLMDTGAIVDLFRHWGCWLFGYAGMWGGKWLMAWVLTGYPIMQDVLLHIGHRISQTNWAGETINAWDAVIANCGVFIFDPLSFVFLAIFPFYVYHVVITKRWYVHKGLFFPFMIVAMTPFLWYMILCNHSYVSAEETYRHLAVTEFAMLCMLIANMEPAQVSKVN